MHEKINYQELGFKSGLEIHQQLDTRKLFCNCPGLLRVDEPLFETKRKLHAVAGEKGEIDIATLHESGKDREFVYQSYDTTCLVELDEEPPHLINQEALKTALHIALLLNAKIFPITQIMRKTVIDGSNTSGFQRTVMIAYDGYIETSFGRVGVDSVYLEEDSARPVEKKDNLIVYRLDRLGVPLVEIATNPDMKNAEQVKETALKIGDILRSCKVKRGIGSIRQDINLSVKGGNRVELKGFQDPRIMIQAIDNEIKRQFFFVEKGIKNPKEVRNVLPDGTSEFLRPVPGAARMYPETDLPLLKISRDLINEAKKTLPKLRSDIEAELSREGLDNDSIKMLVKENKVELYKELLKLKHNTKLVSKMILVYPKDIATRKKKIQEKVEKILEDNYGNVLLLLNKGKINEGDIKGLMENIVDGKSLDELTRAQKKDLNEVEEKIHNIIKSKPGLSENAYMGLVMKEFKGKISGEDAMKIIKKFVKN
jgi:Glu-tRNA(Gln) amidotransferase subunit E-like FAD-binding protein